MRKAAGLQRVLGFGASMALLAAASLLIIPVMMRASGAAAWGAVALGQSLGGIASVIVGYGWNMSGPAQIAGADPTEARRQFLESLLARLTLFIPVCLLAMLASTLSAQHEHRTLAAAGAASSAFIGLSANWYFVGTVQPWILLLTETIPRVLGTLAGAIAMTMGHSALAGVLGQLLGMAVAVALSAAFIFVRLRRAGANSIRSRPVTRILADQKDGVLASATSTLIGALPIVIVAHANPAAQPLFAFVDKLQRQMSVALTPFVTALQGWVPRGDQIRRARRTIGTGCLLCLVLTLGIFGFAPLLTTSLGGGVIRTTWPLNVAMAIYVGLATYELMLSHVVLATFRRLTHVAKVTLVTGIGSLALMVPAAIWGGALGALAMILAGLLARTILELIEANRALQVTPRRASEH